MVCKAENWPASATVNADQWVTPCNLHYTGFSPLQALFFLLSALFLMVLLLQNSHYQDLQEQLGISCL